MVHSTQTISYADASGSDCIKQGRATETQVERATNQMNPWRYFNKAPATKADIIVKFEANERASSSSVAILRVQDSGSGESAYREARVIGDLENDVNRLVDHLIAKFGSSPIRSKAEMDKMWSCQTIAAQLDALNAEYWRWRNDYAFKSSHPLDAQMEECNVHWQEFVFLKRGASDGIVNYAKEWNESGDELQRKLTLEHEALEHMEQQMKTLNSSGCPMQ